MILILYLYTITLFFFPKNPVLYTSCPRIWSLSVLVDLGQSWTSTRICSDLHSRLTARCPFPVKAREEHQDLPSACVKVDYT
jgi:hypothetical protein